MVITSAANEQVKKICKLVKSSGERRKLGLYVVEGIRMVKEIPAEDIQAIYVASGSEEKFASVFTKLKNVEPIVVADRVFEKMSDTNTPQGILALVRMKTYTIKDILGKTPFVLIAEKLQDPGNLGTMIRTAEGSGATGVMLSSDCVDLYNPKVIRSTMGSLFRVPVYVSNNLLEDIDTLKKQNITIYGAHLSGKEFYDKNYSKGCGFLIGNEGNGLSDAVSAKADDLIKIPMMGGVESLNAAISTAVISYEVLRQRFYKK